MPVEIQESLSAIEVQLLEKRLSIEFTIENRLVDNHTDPTLEKIAECESGDPAKKTKEQIANAKNPLSSASGRFQFIASTWEHYGRLKWGADFEKKNVFSYDDNTELAYFVWTLNGYTDWEVSRECWQPIR